MVKFPSIVVMIMKVYRWIAIESRRFTPLRAFLTNSIDITTFVCVCTFLALKYSIQTLTRGLIRILEILATVRESIAVNERLVTWRHCAIGFSDRGKDRRVLETNVYSHPRLYTNIGVSTNQPEDDRVPLLARDQCSRLPHTLVPFALRSSRTKFPLLAPSERYLHFPRTSASYYFYHHCEDTDTPTSCAASAAGRGRDARTSHCNFVLSMLRGRRATRVARFHVDARDGKIVGHTTGTDHV